MDLPGYFLAVNHSYCDPCQAGHYCRGYGTRAQCGTCDEVIDEAGILRLVYIILSRFVI